MGEWIGRSLGTDLASLVLPLGCAGCGRWDVGLCGACRALWAGPLRRCEQDTVYLATEPDTPQRPGLPVWALTPYRGAPRAMVLNWKTHTRPEMRPFFAAVGARAGSMLGAEIAGELSPSGPRMLVLPAPSGWRRRLRRQLVVADLARSVTQGLAGTGIAPAGVAMADLLRTRNASVHRLGASERRSTRRVRLARGVDADRVRSAVVLVDDVVTTGATLAACRRVLASHGGDVVGAVVLAATPRPGAGTWQ